jgi:hypothetical protein
VGAAGWRFLVWVRQTEVNSTTAGCFRCMLELLCLARASYTSLRHTPTEPTLSHFTSLHTPIDLTSLDLTHIHLSIPSSPSRRYRYLPSARSAYRKRLSKPALRGPRNTKLHVGITFRTATAIPWIPPHSHAEFSSPYLRMAGATIPA